MPLYSWTFKMLHPDENREPDFIRIEGEADSLEDFYQHIALGRTFLREEGYTPVGFAKKVEKSDPGPEPTREPIEEESTRDDPDTGVEYIKRCVLSRTTKGYKLEMYGILSNGKPMDFPILRHYTKDRESMERVIRRPIDDSRLPVDKPVNWVVTWEMGKVRPDGGRYRDVVMIEEVHGGDD